MGQFLNLESFFQRPHIPICRRDREQLGEIYTRNDGKRHAFANWLIALMWEEDEIDTGWKTIVYPVEEGRAFWLVPPIFYTTASSTFDKAWRLSEAIKACSHNDELTEKYVHPYWDDWAKV
jgi:hypothetical protein